MKKALFITALLVSYFLTSCGDEDNSIPPINGTWYTFERTVNLTSEANSSDAEYLKERMNVYYAGETTDYTITKTYNDEILKTITAPKDDPDKPINESEASYKIEGDSITINDRIYGSIKYGYLISNNVMTMYGTLDYKRVKDIADQLGIMIPIPSDITGTIKIKDRR